MISESLPFFIETNKIIQFMKHVGSTQQVRCLNYCKFNLQLFRLLMLFDEAASGHQSFSLSDRVASFKVLIAELHLPGIDSAWCCESVARLKTASNKCTPGVNGASQIRTEKGLAMDRAPLRVEAASLSHASHRLQPVARTHQFLSCVQRASAAPGA